MYRPDGNGDEGYRGAVRREAREGSAYVCEKCTRVILFLFCRHRQAFKFMRLYTNQQDGLNLRICRDTSALNIAGIDYMYEMYKTQKDSSMSTEEIAKSMFQCLEYYYYNVMMPHD